MYQPEEKLNTSFELESDVINKILETGTDLRQYSREIEKQLKKSENESIKDYIRESGNIVSLHNQINECDGILERMESMLLNFQSDLGNISSEIISLQKKSIDMSQQLNNRQALRGQLTQFIDEMSVSEELIKGIIDCPVTDKMFTAQLSNLSHKLIFEYEQRKEGVKACNDVKEILEKLKIKAITKIRSFMMENISKFKKPMTNYQVPQNAMLKYKTYFGFLLRNDKLIAHEICNEYADTMCKVYFSYFKSYSSKLMKLQFEEAATKDDLLAVEETNNRGFFTKATLKNKNTVFTIGNRGEVLTSQLEAPIIIPHTAVKNEVNYPFESLFRSEQYALLDNACREYLFICEFFTVRGNLALSIFNQIMARTLSLLFKDLEVFVEHCYDLIALFLCAHMILRYQIMCHKRAVPALDTYWDKLQSIIWPRFEYVFRLNIQSVKNCDPTKFKKELRPHYITRRYAELSSTIVSISESFPNELVTRLLAELLEEVECFILKMAAMFPQRKEQLVFLINNYDMALNILMERIRENSKEVESFRSQLSARSAEYAEEILSPHFGGIIQHVKEGEILLEKGLATELKKLEGKQLALAQSFCTNWKSSLELINKQVLSSFPNLVTGSSILQLTFTQLIQYYHRFNKIVNSSIKSQLPNIHVIMVELKKYKTMF